MRALVHPLDAPVAQHEGGLRERFEQASHLEAQGDRRLTVVRHDV